MIDTTSRCGSPAEVAVLSMENKRRHNKIPGRGVQTGSPTSATPTAQRMPERGHFILIVGRWRLAERKTMLSCPFLTHHFVFLTPAGKCYGDLHPRQFGFGAERSCRYAQGIKIT